MRLVSCKPIVGKRAQMIKIPGSSEVFDLRGTPGPSESFFAPARERPDTGRKNVSLHRHAIASDASAALVDRCRGRPCAPGDGRLFSGCPAQPFVFFLREPPSAAALSRKGFLARCQTCRAV